MRSLISRFVTCFLAITLLCVLPCMVFAAGTVTGPVIKRVQVDGRVQRVTLTYTFTADGEAAMASTTLDPATYGITGWYLYKIKTTPGTPGATNGAWDFDATDVDSFVQTRNLIDDRSSTASQEIIFNSGYPMILSTWTLSIGDNAVNNAVETIELTFTLN